MGAAGLVGSSTSAGLAGECEGEVVGLGNGMGKPVAISLVTCTCTRQYPYPSTRGFSHQNEFKNSQIGPDMSEILLISLNFTKSAITYGLPKPLPFTR